MGSQEPRDVFSGAGLRTSVRPASQTKQQGSEEAFDRLNPAPEHEGAGEDGLGHNGEPEVEVIEEAADEVEIVREERPRGDERGGPRVVKAPRPPTQKEIDEHMATHLPHASWCEICMKGRGRNSPHKRNPQRWDRRRRVADEGGPECSDSEGENSTTASLPEEELHKGPVPRVCMDYFYLSKKGASKRKGGQAMSTKELQKRLRELGKSERCSRQELVRRYDAEVPQEEDGGERDGEAASSSHPAPPHASENPMESRRVRRQGEAVGSHRESALRRLQPVTGDDTGQR